MARENMEKSPIIGGGIDRSTGDIWLAGCNVPILARMTVDGFAVAFANHGAVQGKSTFAELPTFSFQHPWVIAETRFYLHGYFDDNRQLDLVSLHPVTSGGVPNEHRALLLDWLRDHMSQTSDKQAYRWGYLELYFYRSEAWEMRVEYFNAPLKDWPA